MRLDFPPQPERVTAPEEYLHPPPPSSPVALAFANLEPMPPRFGYRGPRKAPRRHVVVTLRPWLNRFLSIHRLPRRIYQQGSKNDPYS